MKTGDLHKTLQQLHEELGKASHVDAESERLLRELLEDISGLLAGRGAAGTHTGLAERLSDMSTRFEDDYPGLVSAIGRLADALSRIGV
jgi:hypothetical protein